MSTAASAPVESRPLTEVERIVDTFVAPSKTFTDIRRNASWWAPWLLGTIIGLALVYVVDQKVGFRTVAENQTHLSPKREAQLEQMPPDQRAAQLDMAAKFTKGFSYAYPVFTLLITAIIAGVLMATFNFGFGAEVRFAQAFAISMYAFLPGTIKGLLAIVIVLATGGENFTFQNPVASNLGPLVDPSHAFLYSLASSIDAFNIWILMLTAIGYSCVTRVKRGTCYGVVFGWWVFNTLLWSAIAGLFS